MVRINPSAEKKTILRVTCIQLTVFERVLSPCLSHFTGEPMHSWEIIQVKKFLDMPRLIWNTNCRPHMDTHRLGSYITVGISNQQTQSSSSSQRTLWTLRSKKKHLWHHVQDHRGNDLARHSRQQLVQQRRYAKIILFHLFCRDVDVTVLLCNMAVNRWLC